MMRAGIYARFGVVRPSTASDSAYCTNWMRGIISAFASSAEARDLSHLSRLNETFPSTLLHPRKRNKTDTLLIVLPRRGQRERGPSEKGTRRGGRVTRGRKRGRRERKEGGKLACLLPRRSVSLPPVAYNSRGPVMFHAAQWYSSPIPEVAPRYLKIMHAAKIASPSPSLSPTFVSIYIYIFNVIVVNRSPSDPKRTTYNRIVFIWDPWMLRSSEEDREKENWENSLLL